MGSIQLRFIDGGLAHAVDQPSMGPVGEHTMQGVLVDDVTYRWATMEIGVAKGMIQWRKSDRGLLLPGLPGQLVLSSGTLRGCPLGVHLLHAGPRSQPLHTNLSPTPRPVSLQAYEIVKAADRLQPLHKPQDPVPFQPVPGQPTQSAASTYE